MSTLTGVAYDAAYPNLPAELAKHPILLTGYLTGPYAYGKAKATQILDAGVGLLPNYERGPTDLSGGTTAGQIAAAAAVAALISWGAPADGTVAIFYSVDASVPTSQFTQYGAAFNAIRQVHAGRFLIGVYGEGALIDWLHERGYTDVKGWLSASSSFPGYNTADPNVGVYQLVGSDVGNTDKDIVTDAGSLGIWWPAGHNPFATTKSLPIEEDMIIIFDQSNPANAQAVYGSVAVGLSNGADVAGLQKAGVPTYGYTTAEYQAHVAALQSVAAQTAGLLTAIQAVEAAVAASGALNINQTVPAKLVIGADAQ